MGKDGEGCAVDPPGVDEKAAAEFPAVNEEAARFQLINLNRGLLEGNAGTLVKTFSSNRVKVHAGPGHETILTALRFYAASF